MQRIADACSILVVGADGLIGSNLAGYFERSGKTIIRTTRRRDAQGDYLDLRQVAVWSPPHGFKLVFLCAGVTAMEACRLDPAGSRAVNVDAPAILADRFINAGASVVFLSTDRVFDGTFPFQKAQEAVCPQTEYGRQKAEAEKRLLKVGGPVRIVRLTKVIVPRAGLLTQWCSALQQGQSITPFSDMVMSPISLEYVTEALCRIGLGAENGIMQLSATGEITYEQAGRRLAARLGVADSLIHPTSAAGKVEHLPAHVTLDASRFEHAYGLPAPDPWAAIDAAVET